MDVLSSAQAAFYYAFMRDIKFYPLRKDMNNQPKSTVDITFINPPSSRAKEFGLLSGAGARRPPLNLLNIGAALLKKRYSVSILDAAAMGAGKEDIVDTITALHPRFIGFTAMTAHIYECGRIADELRANLPGVPIIIGGIHVSTLPVETMRLFSSFDIGIVGEGENTILELIESIDKGRPLSNICGLAIRSGDDIRLTPPRALIDNLDLLPLPAWQLLPDYIKTYQPTLSRKIRLPSAYIVTSRGCPHACSFCNNIVHGRTFRSYSVDYIMKMIARLVDLYAVRDLTIYDENLAFEKNRIIELCRRMISAGYDLSWSCDARVDSIDEEILALMHKAGCRSIWFGMESGNAQILKRYNKKISLEDSERACLLSRKHSIKASGSFIIGGPGETAATIRDTIRFARRIGLDYFVPYYYTPIPGAPDYDSIAGQGKVELDYRLATMTQATFAPYGMTFSGIRRWYVLSLVYFYMRPKIIFRLIKEMGFFELIKSIFLFLINAIGAIIIPHKPMPQRAGYLQAARQL
jgi:anaerobic magnesium-protoporphyrin IX monomethyl ester cyclase